MQTEIYNAPELTVVETDAQDMICTSSENENLFLENGTW